jgi:hypothetical protein
VVAKFFLGLKVATLEIRLTAGISIQQTKTFFLFFAPGLPDGIFSNQKSQFG